MGSCDVSQQTEQGERLFLGEIEGADAKGETAEGCFREACLLEDFDHALALWECLDGGGEVAIGALVLRDETSVDWQERVAIDPE